MLRFILFLWDGELVWEAAFTLKKIGSRYRWYSYTPKNAQLDAFQAAEQKLPDQAAV